MYIDKNSKISQFPALKVRDLLRKLKGSPFALEQVSYYLEEDLDSTKQLLSNLEKDGYIEKSEYFSKPGFWDVTLKGSSLSLASATKPIKRQTAKKVLQEFMERVNKINQDSYYLYKVSKVIVFGSFLTNKERINDLDIAVKLLPKISDPKKQLHVEQQRIKEAYESGRSFNNMIDELFWPYNEVMYFLKSRKRTISLHTTDDDILENCQVKVVFEDDASKSTT
jgi:predicted nucleotidyltransferase